MKDGLGVNMMQEFVAPRAKSYSYLTDNNDEKSKTLKKLRSERNVNIMKTVYK